MSLFTPEIGLVFWMLVVFLVLVAVLGKYAWPAIMKNIDERAAFIDQGVEFTRQAEKDREQARQDAQKLLDDARRQQVELLRQTEQMKREMIAQAHAAAEVEAKKVMEAARLSIEQSKRETERRLREQVGLLSLRIAEKVMRKDLSNDKAQSELIDKLLNELQNKE